MDLTSQESAFGSVTATVGMALFVPSRNASLFRAPASPRAYAPKASISRREWKGDSSRRRPTMPGRVSST